MAKINEYYNVGDRSKIDIEQLLRILEDMYKDLAVAINKKPDLYQRNKDGQSTDVNLNNGDININTNTQKVEMLTAHDSTSAVTWTTLS